MTVRIDLDKRLKAWADTKSPVVPVAWEGSKFTKPTSGYFVETLLLPADTINASLNGVRGRELGIYQINLWIPETNFKQGEADILVNEIVMAFPVVPKLGETSIERIPSKSRFESVNGYRVCAVTVLYRREF